MFPARAGRAFQGFCALTAGLAGALAVSACGRTEALGGRHLEVALMEYRLRPAHVVARPGRLVITVANVGALPHDLVVSRATATTTTTTTPAGPVTATSTVAARVPNLAPGTATTVTVDLAPGRYGLASSVGADASLGAQGTLTVARR
ncbi:MAG TPA: hypothetical protein VFN48_11010 [Solirubrobacteraceae bacterium]|nr:hypothetical protein [Solirubrobacteraceae bacterium]